MTYTDLYRLRSDKKTQMRRIKYTREKWREFVELSEEVKRLTIELKQLAK